jgi:Pentapeptide repeats (8 copies)
LIATPAQAAPATVYIYKVYFDSPGSDRGSNTSLNAEYVVIKNDDDVSHSRMTRVDFTSADLRGADFTRANPSKT